MLPVELRLTPSPTPLTGHDREQDFTGLCSQEADSRGVNRDARRSVLFFTKSLWYPPLPDALTGERSEKGALLSPHVHDEQPGQTDWKLPDGRRATEPPTRHRWNQNCPHMLDSTHHHTAHLFLITV